MNDSSLGASSVTLGPAGGSVAPQTASLKRHISLLDDCRGIAIILVFWRHCEVYLPAWLDHAFNHPLEFASAVFLGKVGLARLLAYLALFPGHLGWVALPIFFVVSGFCIQLSYLQSSEPNFKAFYIRRFFRIYPAYLLALIVFAAVFPWSRLPFDKAIHWGQLTTHLLQCHNLFNFSLFAINGSYWTIAIEVQLYLLFPLISLFARRHSFWRVLLFLALIEVSLHIFSAVFYCRTGHSAPACIRASPFFFCFSWAIGAAIGEAYLERRPLPFTRIHPIVWLIPGVLTSWWPAHEFSFSLFALFVASVIARCLTRGSLQERKVYFGRFIRTTGLFSYSIYLIHGPIIIAIVSEAKASFPQLANVPFLLFSIALASWLLIFPLAALMHYWVERPGIGFGKRLLNVWSGRSAGRVAARAVAAPSTQAVS